jgi:hypothetical protein
MKSFNVIAVVMALSLVCPAGTAQADTSLLTNGNFDAIPHDTGWTVVGDVQFYDPGVLALKQDGTAPGSITQQIGTAHAGTYNVSYDAVCPGVDGNSLVSALLYNDGTNWVPLASQTVAISADTSMNTYTATLEAVAGQPYIGQPIEASFHVTTSWAYFDNFSVTFTPVPEPSSLVLLCVGTIGLLCYAWKKRK